MIRAMTTPRELKLRELLPSHVVSVVVTWVLIAVGLWLLFTAGCQPQPKPDPGPNPPPKVTGCAAACANVRAIGGCDGWQDVDGGETCEQMCGGVQASGEVKLDLACVARASTCSEVDDC